MPSRSVTCDALLLALLCADENSYGKDGRLKTLFVFAGGIFSILLKEIEYDRRDLEIGWRSEKERDVRRLDFNGKRYLDKSGIDIF
jgi:hypothetical protein